jgi:hypothetical protein
MVPDIHHIIVIRVIGIFTVICRAILAEMIWRHILEDVATGGSHAENILLASRAESSLRCQNITGRSYDNP